MKIKICGIRTIESAKVAVEAGADFIGFNFVPSSGRKIKPSLAVEILKQLPENLSTKIVGIFKDQTINDIKKIIATVPLDYVQLHGKETPEFCASLKFPIIKTFNLEANFDPEYVIFIMRKYSFVDLFLLDRAIQGQGDKLNLSSIIRLSKDTRFLLAGGISLDNIKEYENIPKLYGVDVAGGVETHGQLDTIKIRKLLLSKRSDGNIKL